MGVCQRLTRTNDRMKVCFKKLDVEIDRVEIGSVIDIHVVQTNDLGSVTWRKRIHSYVHGNVEGA